MKKRPLCTLCILFVAVQAVRVWFFSAGEEASALEEALRKGVVSAEDATLEGTVYRIEEKDKVTAVYLEDCAVSVSSQSYQESKIMVYIRPEQTREIKKEKDQKTVQESGKDQPGDRGNAGGTGNAGAGVRIGNEVRISGQAAVFDTARNPGNFDQRSYYLRQGIHVLVWTEDMEIISEETDQVRQFLSMVLAGWREILVEYLGEYYGGTMSAILLGDKSGLDADMKKLYQKNGIGHLLAISGLHMSFIGMGIYSLLRRMGLGFVPAGIGGGMILIFYTMMIGAGVSSLRALIMFLVRVGADMTGRDYDMSTSLALAAAVLCIRQPLYVADAGFLLSFGAILGLILLSPVFAELFRPERMEEGQGKGGAPKEKVSDRLVRWFCGALASSLAVNVLLLGPVLYFYFEIPPYSVFLNLLVIPVMPLAMGAGIIGSALTFLSGGLGGAVLKLCGAVLWLYDRLCLSAGMLPGSRFVTGQPGVVWLAVYYAVLGCLCGLFYFLRCKKEKEKEEKPQGIGERGREMRGKGGAAVMRLPGLGLLLCAVLMTVFCRLGYTKRPGIAAVVLDVGQGDSIYIRGPQGRYLIDGGSSDVSSAGIYRIEPCLLANAVDTLDSVFVTHGDEDHINGIQELLEGQDLGVRIRSLVLPPVEYHDEKLTNLALTAQENGTRTEVMHREDEIRETAGGDSEAAHFTLKCLGPAEGQGLEAGNEASLVLALSYGEFRMLFTGDVEGRGEEALCEEAASAQCSILKAAHHGSRNSSTREFLQIAQPSIALISAGVDNRYGHPHQETVERLEEMGCRVYSTQQNGALTVWSDGENVEIKGYLRRGGQGKE